MSFAFIRARFVGAAITAIVCGHLSEGYLLGRFIPATTGLDAGGH